MLSFSCYFPKAVFPIPILQKQTSLLDSTVTTFLSNTMLKIDQSLIVWKQCEKHLGKKNKLPDFCQARHGE